MKILRTVHEVPDDSGGNMPMTSSKRNHKSRQRQDCSLFLHLPTPNRLLAVWPVRGDYPQLNWVQANFWCLTFDITLQFFSYKCFNQGDIANMLHSFLDVGCVTNLHKFLNLHNYAVKQKSFLCHFFSLLFPVQNFREQIKTTFALFLWFCKEKR